MHTQSTSEVHVDWRKYITTDPEVAHGQACFVATCIPVSVVLDNFAANDSHEEVLKSYPSPGRDAVKAASRMPQN